MRLPKILKIIIANLEDIKELEYNVEDLENYKERSKALNEIGSQSISPKLMQYIVRLPKLFEIVMRLEDNVEDLENYKEKSKALNQIGSGEDKQKLKEFSKDIKQLFDDVTEIK